MKINKIIANSDNFTKGRTKKIQFLVIHYTANDGDTAKGNCNYFKSPNRNASAHYFVDENEIWQSVEDNDTAWHCGTKHKYYHKSCRNSNSISIELCSRKTLSGKYYFKPQTVKNAIYLARKIMKKYNIPIENVLRHYDITHKKCPAPFVDNIREWDKFKNMLKGDEYMHLKANYEYNGKIKSIDTINENGTNYVKIRDVAKFLNKNINYDTKTKTTKLSDALKDIKVKGKGEIRTVKAINSAGFNFLKARDIADILNVEVAYDEEHKIIIFGDEKQ